MWENNWPEHLEEILWTIQFTAKIQPLHMVGDHLDTETKHWFISYHLPIYLQYIQTIEFRGPKMAEKKAPHGLSTFGFLAKNVLQKMWDNENTWKIEVCKIFKIFATLLILGKI